MEKKAKGFNFSDYTENPQELVGKLVLHESGASYSSQRSKQITTIEKVTKIAFKIKSLPETNFNLIDGRKKGTSLGEISECELISEEEADTFRKLWFRNRKSREMREAITKLLPDTDYEKLIEVCNLLNITTK